MLFSLILTGWKKGSIYMEREKMKHGAAWGVEKWWCLVEYI